MDRRDDRGGEVRTTTSLSDAAAAAVGSLANRTRLRTLLVLWEADERPVGFSDLRERVGVDDPGQFRYHLRKLEDRFVRRTADGYDITMAGVNVVWAIRSGALTPELERQQESFRIDSECASCGTPLVVWYEDELLYIGCRSCGQLHGMTPIHPYGLVGRTETEVLSLYDRVIRGQFQLVAHDICPQCYGSGGLDIVTDESVLPVGVRERLTPDEREGLVDQIPEDDGLDVVWTCSQCGWWANAQIAVLLCHRPEVAQFYHDHGTDLESVPSWELPRYLDDCRTTVTRTDPLSVVVAVTLDDETLTVSVEGGFSTVSVDRTPVADRSA